MQIDVREKEAARRTAVATQIAKWVMHSQAVLHRARKLGIGIGSHHGRAKLTDVSVREIRSRLAAGESQRTIAVNYGVSHTVIGLIGKRLRWAHVE